MANIIRRNERRNLGNADLVPMLSPMWDPFQIMREMGSFGSFRSFDPLRELHPALERAFVPRFDVKETRDAYFFTADLPGVRDEDLEIYLTGNQLTVTGRREQEEQKEDDQFFAYERSFGTFTRTFALPDGADPEKVEAEFNNGVLRIVIGKRPEVQPRRVSVLGAAKEAKDKVKEKIMEAAEVVKEKVSGGGGASSGNSGTPSGGGSASMGTGANASSGEPGGEARDKANAGGDRPGMDASRNPDRDKNKPGK